MLRMKQSARSGRASRILILVLAAAMAIALVPRAHAGSDGRRGTSGASELAIPVGPRSSALGGAVASDVSGIEAIYWNPAGLALSQGTEVLFSQTSYYADMKVSYAGASTKAGNFGTLGLLQWLLILPVGALLLYLLALYFRSKQVSIAGTLGRLLATGRLGRRLGHRDRRLLQLMHAHECVRHLADHHREQRGGQEAARHRVERRHRNLAPKSFSDVAVARPQPGQ